MATATASSAATERRARLPLAVLLLLSLLSVARAQIPCVVPLVGVGPVDPANGFPKYYQDSTLLGLAPCLDFVCNPALAVPNPAAPISFPGNFPVEVFYQRAISSMTGPNGETFLLHLALEGSFLNGTTPLAGDQIVFTRVRVRATGVAPGATYTVTHPFGVETIIANSPPPRLSARPGEARRSACRPGASTRTAR